MEAEGLALLGGQMGELVSATFQREEESSECGVEVLVWEIV